ncbi:MAG: MmcQ/YjbR family DNA-binding protein [Acidobacteriia bacterium]|nr:MmcQ/YjbR family DNA-binding protein [Terriglobia bacterium]
MNVEWVRRHCLSLSHTTETVQWGDHLLFKIGGKMYAVLPLSPGGNFLSCKASADEFEDLVERPGIIPAPYLARANWVALQSEEAMSRPEVKRLLSQSYSLVLAKLPKKTRAALAQ